MCGIAGIVIPRAEPEQINASLDRMDAGIRSRGPDGTGRMVEAGVGLLHTRLAIIDLVTGDQPVWNETRTACCVFNGEIYNYRELTENLRDRHSFSTQSDTEVLVHLYEDHGPDLLRYLRGMYAFAIWDARLRRVLVARDRLGIKPLYLARLPAGVAFSSSIDSLLNVGASRDPDAQALAQFFRFQKVPEPRTAYAGVTTLLPGHLAIIDVDAGTVAVQRFHRLPRPSGTGAADGVAAARVAFERAVASHLVADVEVAAFLSGGIDSSLVAAQAQRLVSRPIRTFCVAFRGAKQYDESTFAEAVAKGLGTRHETIDISLAPNELVRRALNAAQQPFAVASFMPLLALCEQAARSVKVVLTGDGGDEVGFGYPWYRWIRATSRIPLALRRRTLGNALRSCEEVASRPGAGVVRRALKFGRGALAIRSESSDAWRYDLTAADAEDLLRPDFRGHDTAPSPSAVAWDDTLDDVSALRRVDLEVLLRDEMLPKLDRAGMAFGLEGRVPLLDDDFVDAMAPIPPHVHLKDPLGKAVLRQWARELVPGIDLERPKHGFDVPIKDWLRGGLRDEVDRLLLRPRRRGLTEPAATRRLWKRVERGVPGAAHAAFAALMAETWFEERVLRAG
jgi:asparagine synthase (glutamine-hydrolysing)